MKKLMILGGSRYAIPVIKVAHELGIKTITADYFPGNIAHKYSDAYENIDIVDKEKVLRVAEKIKIDGIVSFACDPGVVSAAYVAERMGLPFQCSYESTSILQDKGKFRKFLLENGFNSPIAESYDSEEDSTKDLDRFKFPVIVKPVDSAGSKGVTKIDEIDSKGGLDNLKAAIRIATSVSVSGRYIIEEYLKFKGYHSSADLFSIDGKLAFVAYSDQIFDDCAENPYTPAKIIWPSSMEYKYQDELTKETQRLFDLLGMRTGIYNIETCVDVKGKPYLMEVSPRGGGCKIAEIQEMAYGVKLIENEVRKAVGLPLVPFNAHSCEGSWCEFVIHSNREGIYRGLDVDEMIRSNHLKTIAMAVNNGDVVHSFTGANMALGDMFLKYDSREDLDVAIEDSSRWLKIQVRG